MKIRTEADIVALEQVPFTERIRHHNVADILRDAAASHGNRTAFRFLSGSGPSDPVRDVGYDEMLRRVIQAANLLRAHGIGPNDTVTLLLPGLPETFIALWAAEIAAVANPVNYFLDATQIAGIMKEASAKALIAADSSIFPDIWPKVEAIRKAMPALEVFRIGSDKTVADAVDFEAACAAQPDDRLLAPKTLARDTVFAVAMIGGCLEGRDALGQYCQLRHDVIDVVLEGHAPTVELSTPVARQGHPRVLSSSSHASPPER